MYHADSIYWREGKWLVSKVNVFRLPKRCIYCNEKATTKQIKKSIYWINPAWYGTILIGLLIFIICILVFRKKAVVYLSLCKLHQQKRHKKIMVGFITVVIGLIVFLSSIFLNITDLFTFGLLIGLIGFFIIGFGSRTLVIKTIKNNKIYFKSCDAKFLESLHQNQRINWTDTP